MSKIRQEYQAYSPDDPPVLLGVFWGWPSSADGRQIGPGAPAIGYWRKSDVPAETGDDIVRWEGMDMVFAVRPVDRHLFEGKVLDYTAERAFFLRAP